MNPKKQFTGVLSSSASPGGLSLTFSSLSQALIWGVGMFAATKGLDAGPITNNLQLLIDQVVTGVTAGMTIYHSGQAAWGLIRKIWYAFAKPVQAPQSAQVG